MPRIILTTSVSLCSLLLGLWLGLTVYGQTDNSAPTLHKILDDEANGRMVDRTNLNHFSDSMGYWQGGQLKLNDKWCPVEQLKYEQMEPVMESYFARRSNGSLDIEGHRQMAVWCDRHGLPEQAKAHWFGVLGQNLSDQQARRELRHVLVNGQWFTMEELASHRDDEVRRVKSLQKWLQIVEKIGKQLQSTDAKTKISALADLKAIQSDESIPVLQQTAMTMENDLAMPFVEAIKRFKSEDACNALLTIAVADPHTKPGAAAIEGLKEYEHFFVPKLLMMLTTPVEMKLIGIVTKDGGLYFERLFRRENRNEIAVFSRQQRLDVTSNSLLSENRLGNISQVGGRWDNFTMPRKGGFSGLGPTSTISDNQFAVSKITEIANAEQLRMQIDSAVDSSIEQSYQNNCKWILCSFAGIELGDSPIRYWNWWADYCNRTTNFTKPIFYDEYSNHSISRGSRLYEINSVTIKSCLTRGTSIQTADGLRSVESIKIGDLVASQNIESGEIALKPVVQTTVRQPAEIMAIVTDAEQIRAT